MLSQPLPKSFFMGLGLGSEQSRGVCLGGFAAGATVKYSLRPLYDFHCVKMCIPPQNIISLLSGRKSHLSSWEQCVPPIFYLCLSAKEDLKWSTYGHGGWSWWTGISFPKPCLSQNCCQYFHLQNQEQTQQEATFWNKAAFQRLWRLGTTSPQEVLGWVGEFGMCMAIKLHFIRPGKWNYAFLFQRSGITAPYGSLCERSENTHSGEDQFQVIHGFASPYSWLWRSWVKSLYRMQSSWQKLLRFCSWLSNSMEKGWELASSPCGLWLDTPQETGRAQQPHWKSHLLHRSKHETVLKRRK